MTERPPVAEMKRQLLARIAELRELEGPWLSREGVDATPLIRASLDAHEAFLSTANTTGHLWTRSYHDNKPSFCGLCKTRRSDPSDCPENSNTKVIQALYEALCGGEK